MNLYDRDDGFRKFTLAEANDTIGEVIAATEETLRKLELLKQEFNADKTQDPKAAEDRLTKETETILRQWSSRIVALGAYPKGYFTVDFKSHIPDTLLCWTLGEDQICHTHKIYETFKHRAPIKTAPNIGFEDSLN